MRCMTLLYVSKGLITATTPLPSVHAHAWDKTLLRWVKTFRKSTQTHTKHNNTQINLKGWCCVYRWRLKWCWPSCSRGLTSLSCRDRASTSWTLEHSSPRVEWCALSDTGVSRHKWSSSTMIQE